ncbi:MAG: hypothetical protein EA377_08725 [Phycisphaerales bacterium]|nr:MAG: hypothetical protein EA377_08725 [Phycisphaerales bacterium]
MDHVKTSGYRGRHGGDTQFQGIRFSYRGDVNQLRHVGIELGDGSVVSIGDIDVDWLANAASDGLAKHMLHPLAAR